MQSANCLRIVSQKENKSHEYKKNLIFDHLRQYIISGDNSLQSLCRACLCIKPQEMHPLLSSKDTTLAEMFTALTAIQVDLDDGLPMYICSNCRKSITNCYEFKTQCKNANDMLKSILKEKVISAMEPTCINKGTAKPRKTKAEYQKAYRERQKAKKKENKQESTAKPRKTKAEYQKEYRERQKAKKKENKQKSTAKPPKTNAEHQKAFRERQKMKKIKNKRERTFIDVDIVCDGDQTIKKELDTEEIMEHSDCTVSETPESHELVSTEPDYLPSRNISERLVNEVENIYDNMEIVKEEQNIEEAIHHHLATVTDSDSSSYKDPISFQTRNCEEKVNNKRKESQLRYRKNREKMRQRETVESKRGQYLIQTFERLSTSSNISRIELKNMSESSHDLEGTQSFFQRNEQSNGKSYLQRQREHQRRYREKNREKLKQREAERRQYLRNLKIIANSYSESCNDPGSFQIHNCEDKVNDESRLLYKEENREKLGQGEEEREKHGQYLIQKFEKISPSSNISRIELEKVDMAQSSHGLEGTQPFFQSNKQSNGDIALQKQRERQRRYREQNREKLKQREAERRQQLRNSDIIPLSCVKISWN